MSRFLWSFLVLFTCFKTGLSYMDGDSWANIELHHSLEGNPHQFTYRGNVSNADIPRPVQNRLKDQEMDNLKALAKRGGFYHLRAIVTYPSGLTKTYLTAIKACTLLMADLNDVLWISVDANGFVNAITQTVATSVVDDCDSFGINHMGIREFYTDVVVRLTELAPVPDTASFIQKVEREREAREKGVKDNRGFFAKYWMYIVPVVLLVFISGATNQEGAK